MKKKTKGLIKDVKEAISSAKEAFLFEPTVEIQGNRQATIQGAKGIIEYTEELIRINLQEQEVRFYGQKLKIDCLSQDSLEIRGRISRIEYN